VTSGTPLVLVDGGVENFNSAVDQLVESGLLKRVLAQDGNHLLELVDRVLVAGA